MHALDRSLLTSVTDHGNFRRAGLPLVSWNVPTLAAITWQDNEERPMNVADVRGISCWMQDALAIEASPLQSDQTCDVVVMARVSLGCRQPYGSAGSAAL
jgi:hypothetical protein